MLTLNLVGGAHSSCTMPPFEKVFGFTLHEASTIITVLSVEQQNYLILENRIFPDFCRKFILSKYFSHGL